MVEIKRIIGSPLGVLIAKVQKLRAFAGCKHKDYSPKSGAPKVPRGLGTGENGDVLNETQNSSLEEAEEREREYFDLAIEPISRYDSLGSANDDTNASISTLVTGLGDPGDTGRWFTYPKPENGGGTTYLYSLYHQVAGTINSDSKPTYLYPNAVTIGSVITMNKNNTLNGSFRRRSRRGVNGIYLKSNPVPFFVIAGNWESAIVYPELTNQNVNSENYSTTLGVEQTSVGMGVYIPGKPRSAVTHLFTNPSLANEHCGGVFDQFVIFDGSYSRDFLPSCYKPELADSPTVVFNHFSYVPLVGHYVDLTKPAWQGKYTTTNTVTGPGFMELVLGQWRVISFTVPSNLTALAGMGGAGGEY